MMYKTITLEEVKQNSEVCSYVESGDDVLNVMGYTDHSAGHTSIVARDASRVLKAFGYDERTIELAKIAGYTHDIGNTINRVGHAQTGALMMFSILSRMGMNPNEIAIITSSIGHHDEKDGLPVNPVSAALIIGDKSDVRRSRVKNKDFQTFDIHDRVNYSVTSSEIEIIEKDINLKLEVDLSICSVAEYFEIFLARMVMSQKAANFLNASFHLYINGTKLL
ncbi:MAG: HD domain-containing protein [Defluviitaleaceae bacterium]|nr:HD domain-containing protein [Defluviitaleaceae bacterium]